MYSSSIPSCVIMDTLWTCIIVVYLVVPLWTRHYGHITDMYSSSIPSCVIMDTLWTCIYSSIPSCAIMDTSWTCVIIVIYLVVSLWTHYGHVF